MTQAPYKNLWTYLFARIILDNTVVFCKQWVSSYKLKEQMVGAARSGKQNIAEGSSVMSISLKSAIKLTNIAKGSLEELVEDYEDFLRQNGLKLWSKEDQRVTEFRTRSSRVIRNLSYLRNLESKKAEALLKQLPLPKDQETAANLMLTLCHQASYLLHKQVASLEEKHKTEGGYTEKLYKRRTEHRGY